MTRYPIVAAVAVVALFGCGRARAPQQQETAASTAPPENLDRALTLVGCLVPGETTTQEKGDTRTPGSPPPPSFRLVDATVPAQNSPASSGVAGTTGTAGTPSVAAVPRSYELAADKERLNDLQRFANSRVEISGSMVASTNTGTSDARRMTVKDVRQVDSKCARTP